MAEMIVTILILGIIVAATTAMFLTGQRVTGSTSNRVENLIEGQRLIAASTKDVRTAITVQGGQTAALMVAKPYEVQFYANLETSASQTAPNKIRIYVDSTNPKERKMVETIQAPDNLTADPPTYGVKPPQLRYIGGYIINQDRAEPIFTFLDVDGAPVSLSAVPTNAELAKIAVVKIRLIVRKTSGAAEGPLTLENRVRLPNVIYNQYQTIV